MKKTKGSTVTLQEYFYTKESGKWLFIEREICIDNELVFKEKTHPNLRGSHKELDAFYQWLLLVENPPLYKDKNKVYHKPLLKPSRFKKWLYSIFNISPSIIYFRAGRR